MSIGGNRSMIVGQQAIVSYTPHWTKLSRSVTSPTPVLLPDKTQLTMETSMSPLRFESAVPANVCHRPTT